MHFVTFSSFYKFYMCTIHHKSWRQLFPSYISLFLNSSAHPGKKQCVIHPHLKLVRDSERHINIKQCLMFFGLSCTWLTLTNQQLMFLPILIPGFRCLFMSQMTGLNVQLIPQKCDVSLTFFNFTQLTYCISPNQYMFFFLFVFSVLDFLDSCCLSFNDSWFTFEKWWLALDSDLNFADSHLRNNDSLGHKLEHWCLDQNDVAHGGILPPPPSLLSEYNVYRTSWVWSRQTSICLSSRSTEPQKSKEATKQQNKKNHSTTAPPSLSNRTTISLQKKKHPRHLILTSKYFCWTVFSSSLLLRVH